MEANAYIANANLSRSRTNHTHGGRVLSLRCSVPLCPIRLRLVSILNAAEGVQPFRFEKFEEDHHNHQAEVEPIRGLSDAQKAVVNLNAVGLEKGICRRSRATILPRRCRRGLRECSSSCVSIDHRKRNLSCKKVPQSAGERQMRELGKVVVMVRETGSK